MKIVIADSNYNADTPILFEWWLKDGIPFEEIRDGIDNLLTSEWDLIDKTWWPGKETF